MTNDQFSEELKLDNVWIDKYNNDLKKQLFFYIEPVKNIKIFNIYINNNKIIYYQKKKINIEDKKIDNFKLLKIIERLKKINNEKFKIIDVLKFQILINNENIQKFLKNEYLIEFQKIDLYKTIFFNDSINIFKNLNSIYIIYKKDEINLKNLTAKNRQKKHNITKKKY